MPEVSQILEKLNESLTAYGPNLLGAILILLLGWFGAKIIARIVRGALQRSDADPILVTFLANIAYLLAVALVVISALGRLGVNTTSFAAVIAAAGLAIGLALQGSLSNFASGVLLIFFRHFKKGDFVEVAGVSGSVEAVQVFATVLKTGDNKRVIVPNSAITSSEIVNYSTNPTRRVDMVFGIGYDDDLKHAKAVLERLVSEDERILEDPAPKIAISELADSSVNFVVRPWVKTEDYWNVFFDMHEKVKLTFDAEGISIPFPQQDVHHYRDDG